MSHRISCEQYFIYSLYEAELRGFLHKRSIPLQQLSVLAKRKENLPFSLLCQNHSCPDSFLHLHESWKVFPLPKLLPLEFFSSKRVCTLVIYCNYFLFILHTDLDNTDRDFQELISGLSLTIWFFLSFILICTAYHVLAQDANLFKGAFISWWKAQTSLTTRLVFPKVLVRTYCNLNLLVFSRKRWEACKWLPLSTDHQSGLLSLPRLLSKETSGSFFCSSVEVKVCCKRFKCFKFSNIPYMLRKCSPVSVMNTKERHGAHSSLHGSDISLKFNGREVCAELLSKCFHISRAL